MSSVIDLIFKQFMPASPSREHNEVLEPLSCMIRLAMLNYKPDGTKISISGHRILFQPPNILQGPIRWKNGDTRLDIHNLFKTIQTCLNWYDTKNDNFKYICNSAKTGLAKLDACYNNSSNVTSHSIQLYIDLIDKSISDEKEEVKENIYYLPFKKLWNTNQIRIIYLMLKELEIIEEDEERYTLINAIESILFYKDDQVRLIVNNYSTSL